MKVVLLKDVRGVGRAHSIIDVSDGHAINHLIPQKIAIPATGHAVKSAQAHAAKADEARNMHAALVKATLEKLGNGVLTITKKANDKGHLYDAVDAKDVAAVAQLPEEVIALEKPIKELGRFTVPVQNGADFGSVEIEVVAE